MAYPVFHPRNVTPLPLMMSRDEFIEAFSDEGQFVEWKRGASLDRIEEAGVAFSNAEGGVLLLGVEDDGNVVGQPLTDGIELRVHKALGRAHGMGKYDILATSVEQREITVVAISAAREGVAQTHDGRPLVRRGKQDVSLVGDELFLLASRRTRIRYERSDTEVLLDGASPPRLEVVRNAFGWSSGPELVDRLREHHLVTEEPPPRLTVAGALYLLENPTVVLGRADIEVYRYQTVEGDDYDKRVLISGPADQQVMATTELLASELGTDLVVLGTHRHELPRIPPVVLREAVANAVAHRQYQLRGVSIRVEVRPDHVLIESPGQLPEPVTVGNIREAQSARNSSALRVLRRLRLAEDAGRGIDVMEDTMRAELLEPPEFAETSHSVRVRLPLGSTITPRERAWIREIEQRGSIRPEDRVLLLHATRGESLTNSNVRDLLGVDSVHARLALQRLRDADLLEQHGHRGGTQYTLVGGLAPPAGLKLAPRDLERIVLEVAEQEGVVTNQAVRERTGLDRAESLRVLNGLVACGLLERHGERRGSYYTLPSQPDQLDLRPSPSTRGYDVR